MIEKKIKELFEELNIKKFGFGNLFGIVPEQFSNISTGISFVIRLSDAVIDQISDYEPTHTYFHHYRTVNAFIDHVSLRLVMLLQNEGYSALAVPASQSINTGDYDYSGVFQHRTAATNAGIGWIGKNNCLVTEEYGPRVRLGTVLTNFKTEYAEPIMESKCGNCRICVSKCPSLALIGENWTRGMDRDEIVDAKVCSNHMSREYKHIGRGVVCGICVKVCPIGSERIKNG